MDGSWSGCDLSGECKICERLQEDMVVEPVSNAQVVVVVKVVVVVAASK